MGRMILFLLAPLLSLSLFAQKTVTYNSTTKNTAPTNIVLRAASISIASNSTPAVITLALGGRTTNAANAVALTNDIPFVMRSNITVGASGTAIGKIISATATLNFGSISAQSSADLTITVTGAAVGDSVYIGPPSAPTAGIIFWGFVSATDTVTVRASNITAGAIDPASFTFRAAICNFQ